MGAPKVQTNQEAKKKKGGLAKLPKEKQDALLTIKTIVGHTQGIERMIEEERYCIDILKQIAAVQASLSKLANLLTKDHMRMCVTEAIKQGNGEEKIEELAETLKYLRGG